MAKKSNGSQDQIVRGSGNVFADLGLPDAKELHTKLRLAYAINEIVDGRRLTQAGTAELLGVPQPKVSSLKNYKLEGFSVERLMTFLDRARPGRGDFHPKAHFVADTGQNYGCGGLNAFAQMCARRWMEV